MVKVLFYHWDWKDQSEVEPIQRAIDAVFDGRHAPRITDKVSTADWDQCTIAITSEPLNPEVTGELFLQYLDSDLTYWWNESGVPKPLETA